MLLNVHDGFQQVINCKMATSCMHFLVACPSAAVLELKAQAQSMAKP